jgi:hypothetical protein
VSGEPKTITDHIPEIDPTPAMIEAGAVELSDYVLSDVGPALRRELAAAVYEAMEAVKAKAHSTSEDFL